ncbi:transcription factor bHLH148-like [Henckelia pumila]|uniref:transcription factor bHLH148-like n=1 Tax=Henckelia pumila TaxID=405737 RepID=UPI003C6DF30C
MSSSLLSPDPAVNPDRSATSSRRRRKKKIQREEESLGNLSQQKNLPIQWKSDSQQQIYSSKLLQALRQVQPAQKSAPRRVREAADRVLAATAKGRSRWSRAMLTNRLKIKFMKKHSVAKRQQSIVTTITRSTKKSKVRILRLSLPSVQRKTRVLSRLVPGCRKQPLPVVLEEATDYIAALEMQVRAMTALAELHSVSGSSSSSGGHSHPSSSQPPAS